MGIINKVLERFSQLEILATIVPVIITFIKVYTSFNYAHDCAMFYGIDSKYFFDERYPEENLYRLGWCVVTYLVMIFTITASKKADDRGWRWICYIIMFIILVIYSFASEEFVLRYFDYTLLSVNASWGIIVMMISLCVLCTKVLSVKRNSISIKEILKSPVRIVAWGYFCVVISIVYIMMLTSGNIDDKKDYEIIGGKQAIVANYDEYVVLMKCDIESDNLILHKYNYELKSIGL